MEISENKFKELIYQFRLVVREEIKRANADNRQPDMVTTSEAASILGITPSRLRQIVCEDPLRYPHTKQGDTKQAKLLFVREALIK
ncbi:MAG: hypothetical protein IJ760_01005 [Bacteroidales bacterium]|nr:hypothetical protein [Bacteroidales bacterium]